MSGNFDPVAAALDAQRLARRGLLGDAESLVHQVRDTYRIETDVRLAAQLMIAEGCIAAYRCAWNDARDRLSRARLIAKGQGQLEAESMAAAWLSHVEFNDGSLDRSLQLAASVVAGWRTADPYALFRAGATLSLLCYLSGATSRAERWQAFSKRMAELAQDSSATSALIFDVAAMRLAAMRFAAEIEGKRNLDFGRELAFCRSAKNFDSMAGVRVMSGLHLLVEAQALNLAGRHEEAARLLAGFGDEAAELSAPSRAQGALEAVWSRFRCDPRALQVAEVQAACAAFGGLTDDDDVAVYGLRLADMCEAVGMQAESGRFIGLSREASARFVQWRRDFGVKRDEAFGTVGVHEDASIDALMVDISTAFK